MQFSEFVQYCFYGVASGGTMLGVKILWSLKDSIDTLNKQIAIIIERTTYHEKQLEKHDERLSRIEELRFRFGNTPS